MYRAYFICSQDMVGQNCIRVPLIGLELAIDPPPPRGGDFVDYDFLRLHSKSHKNEICKDSENGSVNV